MTSRQKTLVWCHGVHREAVLPVSFPALTFPFFHKVRRGRCRCQLNRWPKRLCKGHLSFLAHPDCALPLRWMVFGTLGGGRTRVLWFGPYENDHQAFDVLSGFGVDCSEVLLKGTKRIELFINLSRHQSQAAIDFFRTSLNSNLSPHRFVETEPSTTDPKIRTLLYGHFLSTTLPCAANNGASEYTVKLYWVEPSPRGPAKLELTANAPGRPYTDREAAQRIRYMSGLLRAIAGAAGLESLPLYRSGRHQQLGQPIKPPSGHGGRWRQCVGDAILFARELSGLSNKPWDTVLDYDALRSALELYACRVLSPSVLSKTLKQTLQGQAGLISVPGHYKQFAPRRRPVTTLGGLSDWVRDARAKRLPFNNHLLQAIDLSNVMV